jgi:hypothetical protein
MENDASHPDIRRALKLFDLSPPQRRPPRSDAELVRSLDEHALFLHGVHNVARHNGRTGGFISLRLLDMISLDLAAASGRILRNPQQ